MMKSECCKITLPSPSPPTFLVPYLPPKPFPFTKFTHIFQTFLPSARRALGSGEPTPPPQPNNIFLRKKKKEGGGVLFEKGGEGEEEEKHKPRGCVCVFLLPQPEKCTSRLLGGKGIISPQ